MNMRTAIIIVTHNSVEYLPKLCSTLRTYVDHSQDGIIFVDNNSSDGTLEFLQKLLPAAHIIRMDQNIGFSKANNLAARNFPAAFYLFLNPDTYLTNDVVSDILSRRSNSGTIDIVGPRLVYPDGSHQSSAYSFSSPAKWLFQDLGVRRIIERVAKMNRGRHLLRILEAVPTANPFVKGILADRDKWMNATTESVDWVTGACMLISRRVFEATGGFDENIFLYGEDEELCFRAKKMGFKRERVNAGPVVHYGGWQKNRRNLRVSLRAYNSLLYMIDKNYKESCLRRRLMRSILKRRLRSSGSLF